MCEPHQQLWVTAMVVSLLCGPTTSIARGQQDGTEPRDSSGVQRVSLAQLLEYATDNAPQATVARSRLAIGTAAEEAASPRFPANPTLRLNAGSRSLGRASDLELQATMLQPLEVAGERRLRIKLAKATQDLANAELDAAQWTVHQAIHATFHASLVARERATLAQELLDFQNQLLRIARGRVNAGDVSPLTERLAEAEVAQAQQGKIAADQRYLALCLSLAELAGWPDHRPLPEPAGTLQNPWHPPSIERLLTLASQYHPALAVRGAAVEAARARSRTENRDGWPHPSVGVATAREGAPGGGPHEWTLTGILVAPFPFWQRNQAARATANAQLEMAEATKSAVRRVLRYRLRNLASAVEAAAARTESYGAEVLPRFEEHLLLLRRSFELGEIDLLQLSVGRDRFLRIQLDALAAKEDYFTAVAALEAELGTDPWSSTEQEKENGR